MQIRKMTIHDYDPVFQLWLSCKGMGLNNLDDSEEGISRFLNRNPDSCFVADVDGRIAGVIISGHDGRRGYIYHTAVHPEYRRCGIASALVEAAVDALQKCGIHKVALVVFGRNTDGNAFWESVGFSRREDLVYRNKAISEILRIDT